MHAVAGVDQLDQLQASIDAASAAWALDPRGRRRAVTIEGGDLEVRAMPRMKSGVWLRATVTAAIVAHASFAAPPASAADDRGNGVMYGEGDLHPERFEAVLSSHVAPAYPLGSPPAPYFGAGARKLSTTIGSGAPMVGMSLALTGWESNLGEAPGGPAALLSEAFSMYRVSAVEQRSEPEPHYVLTLTWPTKRHHQTGPGGDMVPVAGGAPEPSTPRQVRAVEPLFDVRFERIRFDQRGGTWAVGLRLDWARKVEIVDCEFAGFSRACLELRGCDDVWVEDPLIDDEASCGILVRAGGTYKVVNYRHHNWTKRCHDLGKRRASIFLESQPIGFTVDGFHIEHAVQGISFRGGRTLSARGGTIDDLDIRLQAIDEVHGPGRGVALDCGAGEHHRDEYVGSVKFSDIAITNVRQAATTNSDLNNHETIISYAVCLHDAELAHCENVSIDNVGLSDGTVLDGDPDYRMAGFGFLDCNAYLTSCQAKGCQIGYAIRTSHHVVLDGCTYLGAPGSGPYPPSNVAIWFACGSVEVRGFDAHGGSFLWFASPLFVPPYTIGFSGTLRLNDQLIFGPLEVAKSAAPGVVQGSVVGLDPSSPEGERRCRVPQEGDELAAVAAYTSENYRVLKLLPSESALVRVVVPEDEELHVSDPIDFVPGSTDAVGAATVSGRTIGKSLDARGPGTWLVRLQPAGA